MTCLKPLTYCGNVACLSLFNGYYFGWCSSELTELIPLPYSCGRSTHSFDRMHDFSVIIPTCYKDVYVNHFFPRRAKLWNSLSVEFFLLTFHLKPSFNRHLSSLSSFWTAFLHAFYLFLLFIVTLGLEMTV